MAHWRGRDNINERVVKIETLFADRPTSFVFQFRSLGLRIDGRDMTLVDFQANVGADIAFTYAGSVYQFAKADIEIVRRIRSRKYAIEPSTVTII